MWFTAIATFVVCALIYRLFFHNPNKNFWKKRGVFEVDVSKVVKPYEVLLQRKTAFDGDRYAYEQMGPSQPYCGVTLLIDPGTPMLVVKDLDLIKRIMIKDFDYFVDHRNFFTEADGSLHKVLPSLTGDEWKGVRSAISPTFTTGKIRKMMNIFNSAAKEWVEHYTKEAEASPEGSIKIQVSPAVHNYTVEVIASSVFGMNAGAIKNPEAKFNLVAESIITPRPLQMIKFGIRNLFPWIKRLVNLPVVDMEAIHFLEDIFTQAVKERLEGKTKRNDFVQLLAQAKKGELETVSQDELNQFEKDAQITGVSSPEKKEVLTEQVLNGQSISFFFAGFSPTSNLIVFSLYAMALDQRIQERLRAEVNSAFREDGSLDYDDLGKLVYLDMIAHETLRKFASSRLERVCVRDYRVEETGLVIPKGVLVSIPINALHHDKRYYDNPDAYDPEHFSPENKAKRSPYAWMPFGMGPRNCIGMRFALVEGKAAIAHIVHHFQIDPTDKTPSPMQSVPFALSLGPPKGLELKFTPI